MDDIKDNYNSEYSLPHAFVAGGMHTVIDIESPPISCVCTFSIHDYHPHILVNNSISFMGAS